ncbi:MAG TPA: DNA (cytosine-5-)-methyltransferase [Acidobacteriota bacterium]|nr:DNA (cytosine-5-)-methyltransferase [Acidobacteriota bacterium]
MVRAGLGSQWHCLFANDFDHKKSRIYRENWGRCELVTSDIRALQTKDVPGTADLAWASFPCQDLSLAGGGAGLKGDRSGTFWPFWGLIRGLAQEDRAPSLVVLENVCGTLTSHKGADFSTICEALRVGGYRFGAIVADAALFVPQSRPRLFIVCVRENVDLPEGITTNGPSPPWHTRAIARAFDRLPSLAKRKWVWWELPRPAKRTVEFADLIEEEPTSVTWFSPDETLRLLDMMSPVNRAKVIEAQRRGRRIVGTVYKRTRTNANGRRVQRAEIRFDGLSGCLRTPAGGSSRQVVVVVDGESVKSRLISSRETARLMGLTDDYVLPRNYNEAYHLTGDGVVVPVVRHLASHLFELILKASRTTVAA